MSAPKRGPGLASLEAEARELGRAIKRSLPARHGFVLVLYDYGAAGNMTFLSSGDRGDTIKMLEELLANIKREQS